MNVIRMSRVWCLIALGAGAWCFGSFAADRPDVMAIYYPNWHRSVLQTHFGEGWTEWEYVKSASARYKGHEQPIVPTCGYLDGANPEDSAKEIDLAADAGIDVFLFDYYYYGGHKMLHEALEDGFLKARNRRRMKFALMWCCHELDNEFRPKPDQPRERLYTLAKTPSGFAALIEHCVARYFAQPEYYRLNGALYFSIYSPQVMMARVGAKGMRAALDAARRRVREAGLGEIHFNAQGDAENSPEMAEAGFDSLTAYVYNPYHDPAYYAQIDRGEWLYDYASIGGKLRAYWDGLAKGPLAFNPVVPTGWDPTPRARLDVQFPLPAGKNGYPYCGIYTNATAQAFGRYLEMAKGFVAEDPRRSLVQIYAWNEYTEGGWLLPDNFQGDARLRAVERVFGIRTRKMCTTTGECRENEGTGR